MIGIFNTITINTNDHILAPNDFTLEREDVYSGEITTCTGKTIADCIGWKYADMSLNWDYLPQTDLSIILALNGAFTLTFNDESGTSQTENVIRKNSGMTGTRFTDANGNVIWKGVSIGISFLDVHTS